MGIGDTGGEGLGWQGQGAERHSLSLPRVGDIPTDKAQAITYIILKEGYGGGGIDVVACYDEFDFFQKIPTLISTNKNLFTFYFCFLRHIISESGFFLEKPCLL